MPWQALATLGAGIIGAYGQNKTNLMNMHIAQMNNEYNRQMMRESNQWNLDHWHRMNAYNDPSEQRKRLEKAGINPAIALGSISPGTAESLTSAGAHPAETPQLSNPMQPLADGVTNSMNQYLQAKTIEAQIHKTNAETDAILIDNQTRSDMNNNTIEGGKLDNEVKRQEIKNKEFELLRAGKLLPLEEQELVAKIKNTEEDTAVKESQRLLNMYDLNNIRPEQRKLVIAQTKHTLQTAFYMILQGQVARAQLPLLAAQVEKTIAEKVGIQANTRTTDVTRNHTLRIMEAQYDNLVKDGKLKEQDIQYRPGQESRENLRLGLDFGVAAVNGATSIINTLKPW